MSDFKFPMGAYAQDRISGLKGTIIGQYRKISSSDKFLLQPPCPDDSKFKDPVWFDESRLRFLDIQPSKSNDSKLDSDKPGKAVLKGGSKKSK